ncbi:glycoside hydrolase family 2 TIM barrel-domain containing protein [Cystobacter fuscus]|nr:glycoside hydrolase family 2 TIM barrel-domain containing protein [Cystobacter fuscus]
MWAAWLVCLGLGCVANQPVPPKGEEPTPPATDQSPGRRVDFDRDWKFVLVNPEGITDPSGSYATAHEPSFDDSSWRKLNVPHDWSIERDPSPGPGTTSGTGFFQGGLGWYRKTFTLPSSMAGKKLSIEFDGVYMDSYVYVNGELVGNHPYGYTAFDVDLSSRVYTDGVTPNVIAVKVQNQLPSSRWYSGSGIYRHVHLTVTDPIHVVRWGTFVTVPELEKTVGEGYANVRVQTDVVNEGGTPKDVEVRSLVKDANGKVVAQVTSLATALGPAPQRLTATLRVEHPTLWSLANPYRYTLETALVSEGKEVDTTSTRFGMRYFRIDPNEGFSLNGESTKIQGVDLHHDLGALGAAVHRDALVRQMTIMKSMGVNALRTAHNPPAPELIDICEEMGIVMLVEAFDSWRTGKNPYDYGRFFDEHSDADIKEMVNAAKNSPAVIMWSIGNEIPDSTSEAGLAMAQRLVEDIKSIDTSRPIVIGSDKYRRVPAPESPAARILGLLDGLGLNYNTAKSVDGLRAAFPGKFLFESESSSETSTRGVYQDPHLLNTGENYTPGKRGTSSYDNNLASWTMSGEYGLKKDRDRKFFAGEFLWSGIDYIGEPTPYDVYPVKASFFGAVDTAGFPKDMYYLFKSQWTQEPMVHLLPMNWTDHAPGQPVAVWAYANVDTVELLLNGQSLGERKFSHKKTLDGRAYLETDEATGDDKTFTSGPFPGSYTSPNGSAGKLHLSWSVPFAPGELVAVAKKDGVEVARDVLRTAGAPNTLRLTPDKTVITADGKSLVFVTAEVVDSKGVMVPSAANLIHFQVTGGALVGADNGRQESAENYKASSRTAFNGKALAIIQSSVTSGPITVTASSDGLTPGSTTIVSEGGSGSVAGSAATSTPVGPARSVGTVPAADPEIPTADASYSGSPQSVPAAMLDGNKTSGGWSNFYEKAATALLPAVSQANASDWVSLKWPQARSLDSVTAWFTTGAKRVLPASLVVTYWDGKGYVPVSHPSISWASASNQPTVISFDPVQTTELRLEMTSPAPGSATGFLQISELEVPVSR